MSPRLKLSKRVAAVLTVIGLSFSLAACSDDPKEVSGAAGSGESAQSESQDDTDEVAAPEENLPLAGKDCLTGTWIADNRFFLASMREFGDQTKDVSGEVILTFDADGTLTTEYKKWRITAVSEGVEVKLNRSGTDKGKWSADDKSMTLKDTEMTSKLTMTGPGMNMTVDSKPANYSKVSYTCSATAATVSTPDGAMKMTRR